MSQVTDHYDHLLARHYTWMFGASFAEKVAEQKAILAQALTFANTPTTRLAIDLGSGPGFQSVALAELGFAPVLAVDTSAALLEELRAHAELLSPPTALSIQTHPVDLRALPQLVPPGAATAIVCMGDTITHLPRRSDVSALFRDIATALAPGGAFVLTWRDLTAELCGTDRFIPVRSDENTVMICFLEYTDEDHVTVHDLVYTREADGWSLNKSSYPKLRLSPTWIAEHVTAAGLVVEHQGPAGRLLQLVARKP